jgi:hypothetical protein
MKRIARCAAGRARPDRARELALCLILASGIAAAESPAGAPTLPALFARLAAAAETRVRFVELKTLSVLERPLRLEGTLEFRPPGYLAKHVEKPAEEHYIIEDGRVTVSKPGEQQTVNLALSDYPPLEAFAESLRAPLAGDLAALQRYWRPSLGGSWKHWLLALTPLRPELATFVRGVRLEGRDAHLTRLTIEETGGDTATLSFEPAR